MLTTLTESAMRDILDRLGTANVAFAHENPGPNGDRQPVHTIYGGAHLFKSDSVRRLGELALRSLADYAPDAGTFANAIGLEPQSSLAKTVYDRVLEKLRHVPVEDFRIDFEDGYGHR